MQCGSDPAMRMHVVSDFRNPSNAREIGLGEDALFVESTNGLSVGLSYQSPKPFPFSCLEPDKYLLGGLSNNQITGLMNTTTSLHSQFSSHATECSNLPYLRHFEHKMLQMKDIMKHSSLGLKNLIVGKAPEVPPFPHLFSHLSGRNDLSPSRSDLASPKQYHTINS
ncbi:hypothetical protein POM88_054322 [Heracleum sosnowskyi]|uniref:Uncharacterized protein n=1 Tax=Heracleum sosnowskyi TaxID=360622 RepID=A0AAD8GMJ7_9APIA|nr:hypothetical protein POM88_054322 [Heracleum sosnowskyi]